MKTLTEEKEEINDSKKALFSNLEEVQYYLTDREKIKILQLVFDWKGYGWSESLCHSDLEELETILKTYSK